MDTSSAICGLGVEHSSARRVAALSSREPIKIERVRRVVVWIMPLQALCGSLLFAGFSIAISVEILGGSERVYEVALLGLGVGLSVISASQSAFLQGQRRIVELAKIQVVAGVLGALVGSLSLVFWGERAILLLLLISPLASFFLGAIYVRRRFNRSFVRFPVTEILVEWGRLLHLGVPLMVAALVSSGGMLAVRVLVQREHGVEALGYFQAAWLLGVAYLGLIIGAMVTDFYPRLSSVLPDHRAAIRLVNEQTEVGLLLCGPPLVLFVGAAPDVLALLYSQDFVASVALLRWHLLADILKVASVPLGFVVIAAGSGRGYLFAECAATLALVSTAFIGLPVLGVNAAGVSVFVLYLVYLPMVFLLSRRLISFRWSPVVKLHIGVLAGLSVSVAAVCLVSQSIGFWIGTGIALMLAAWSFYRICEVAQPDGALRGMVVLSRVLRERFKRLGYPSE